MKGRVCRNLIPIHQWCSFIHILVHRDSNSFIISLTAAIIKAECASYWSDTSFGRFWFFDIITYYFTNVKCKTRLIKKLNIIISFKRNELGWLKYHRMPSPTRITEPVNLPEASSKAAQRSGVGTIHATTRLIMTLGHIKITIGATFVDKLFKVTLLFLSLILLGVFLQNG